MSDDFATRLRLQLREAAKREERRGPVARRVAGARSAAPQLAVGQAAAALVVAIILAATLYAVTHLRPEPAAPPTPKVVVRMAPAANLGTVSSGFGSAWLDDTARHLLLRMDPGSHRVTARIAVRGEAAIAAGAGAMWVVESSLAAYELTGPLLRIDPHTNRVTARIALRTPAGKSFRAWTVIAGDDVVWVVGPSGALRIDPGSNRVTGEIALHSAFDVDSAVLVGNGLWMLTADGRLLRFDAHTGARTAALRTTALRSSDTGDLAGVGDALIVLSANELARVDLHTGRTLWRAHVRPVAAGGSAVADGLLWVPTRDRLVAIDPLDGRVVSSVDLGEFGAVGVGAVGSELWLATAGGHVVALR
jgi:putative pyrroloquinoline-quinone binding quinoprotein